MSGIRDWFGGFAWGLVFGCAGTIALGVVVFRPDLIDRLRSENVTVEKVQKALTPARTADGRNLIPAPAQTQPGIDITFSPPRAVAGADDLVIRGHNTTSGAQGLNVRMDDAKSQNWMTRYNQASDVAPGPFTVRIPLDALTTPGGTKLDLNAITRIILFTLEGSPTVTVDSVTMEPRQSSGALTPPAATNLAMNGQTWLAGARPTAVQEFAAPISFAARQELVLTGDNTSGKPVTVSLRIDDAASKNWYSRVTVSSTFPPGAFTLRAPVSSWITPGKTRLDREAITRLIVFIGEGEGPIKLGGVHVESGSPVPEDALALRFAPSPDISVPGFETVLPNDPRLGRPAGVLVRTQNDPLLSSGLNGIETVTIPWTQSTTATVSLWTEDQGEWEYFPHSLNRTITINGQVVLQESYTPDQWIDQVYLRNTWKEAMIDGGPWEVYAKDRAGLITATVPVVDGKIVVNLQSDQPPNNGYLAAMVIEPGDSTKAVDAIEAWRRARYLERWPVVDKPVDPALAQGTTLRVIPSGGTRSQHPFWNANLPVATTLRAARGAIVSVDFLAFSNQDDLLPDVSVSAPDGISPTLRWGKWSFMRRDAAERALTITSDILEGDLAHMRIAAGIPRRINMTFNVPANASGMLPVVLTMDIAGTTVTAQVNVDVVPVTLPEADRPVGYYMGAPNTELWFPPTPAEADRLMRCDLNVLRAFGLTGLSPELVTPVPERIDRYVQQTRLVHEAGFLPPYLDYTSVKRLLGEGDAASAGRNVAATMKRLAISGLPAPLWAISDEPQPGEAGAADIRRIRDAIRISAPDADIAGQLNDAKVKDLVPLFNTVLVNNGFGTSAAGFADIRAAGVTPWFYNMPNHRAASGFFLWRVKAAGYLQWHARVYTADPRDPTDGRETDFAVLPLASDRCALVPTIDATLIDMTDGIQDLRWLLWLEARAASDPKAAALRDSLIAAIPADWTAFAKAPPSLSALRGKIIDFAMTSPGG